MKFPDLPAGLRMEAAQCQGAVEYLIPRLGPLGLDAAVEQLHEVTTNARVLGHVLGIFLARADWEPERPTAELAIRLLRAAGADEQVAEMMVEWQRWRNARNGRV